LGSNSSCSYTACNAAIHLLLLLPVLLLLQLQHLLLV
jgi:hypothetical protein